MVNTLLSIGSFPLGDGKAMAVATIHPCVHFLTGWERDSNKACPCRATGSLKSFPHCWQEDGVPSRHLSEQMHVSLHKPPPSPTVWLLSSIRPECLTWRPLPCGFLWTPELLAGNLKVLQIALRTSLDRPSVFNLSFLIGVSTQWAN